MPVHTLQIIRYKINKDGLQWYCNQYELSYTSTVTQLSKVAQVLTPTVFDIQDPFIKISMSYCTSSDAIHLSNCNGAIQT